MYLLLTSKAALITSTNRWGKYIQAKQHRFNYQQDQWSYFNQYVAEMLKYMLNNMHIDPPLPSWRQEGLRTQPEAEASNNQTTVVEQAEGKTEGVVNIPVVSAY